MDVRLVPDQDGAKVFRAIERHVSKHCPTASLTFGSLVPPSVTLPELPVCVKILEGMKQAYGRTLDIAPLAEGTLPNFAWTKILGTPSVCAAYANPDENNHAPAVAAGFCAAVVGTETCGSIISTAQCGGMTEPEYSEALASREAAIRALETLFDENTYTAMFTVFIAIGGNVTSLPFTVTFMS
jgi:hypothetical protein